MSTDPIVVVSALRTPLGAFQGALSSVAAPRLGAAAIRGALARIDGAADAVDEVFMGNVLPAGLGQAPARQAALGGGLPERVPCTTVSKVCGSGMKAVMLAHDAIAAGSASVVVAGGMESMSGAPYLLPKARGGLRLGHGEVKDHMFLDGLEDAYEPGRLMGTFAEDAAAAYQIGREAQDDYALLSLERARRAAADGAFADEIVPVTVEGRGGAATVDADEGPARADPARIRSLKPAFAPDGTVTAANASSISDGAAALVLMRLSEADRAGLAPLARIVAHAGHAEAPRWFTRAPVGAVRRLVDKAGWRLADVDIFEVNEAFAVVALIAMRELSLPEAAVNVHGGATALGHPIGASGARILVTLLHALARGGGRRGIATLCIGGGEATAVAVERL
jgi:acetyl-CoA C-acetyltransferase